VTWLLSTVRIITNLICFQLDRIPSCWLGILFFCSCVMASADTVSSLAEDLFNESNWAAARVEARRILHTDPVQEKAAAIEAASLLRQTPADALAFATLTALSSNASSSEVRAWALSEIGFTQWARNDKDQSLLTLTRAFQESEDAAVRARTSFGACILLSYTKASPEVRGYWGEHMADCLPTWNKEIRRAGAIRPAARGKSIWSWPGELIVKFYRGQIAPAIGSRCTLEPSCSEYFRQACRKNGWLGFPMTADRFIREPGVVRDAEKPVRVRDTIRYADPVEDHVPF
jgi:putative component of membrane protein insertase Oxa1/YidC/SpoIIIJ protein YidD